MNGSDQHDSCPHCGERLDSGAGIRPLVCPACGKPLPAGEASIPGFEPPVDLSADAFGMPSTPRSTSGAKSGEPVVMGALDLDLDPFSGADELFESGGDSGLADLGDPLTAELGAGPLGADPLASLAPGGLDSVSLPSTPIGGPDLSPGRPARGSADEFDFGEAGTELSGINEIDLSLIGTYSVGEDNENDRQDSVWDGARGRQPTPTSRPARARPKSLAQEEREAAASGGDSSIPVVDRLAKEAASAADDDWSFDPPADAPKPAPPVAEQDGLLEQDPFAALDPLDLDVGGLDDGFDDLSSGPAPTAGGSSSGGFGAGPAIPGGDLGGDLDDLELGDDLSLPPLSSSASAAPPPPAPNQSGAAMGSAAAPAGDGDTYFIEEPSLPDPTLPEVSDLLELEDLPPPPMTRRARAASVRIPTAGGRRGKGRRGRGRKSAGGSRRSLLLFLLLVVAGGAALGFTEYGFFGLDALFPSPTAGLKTTAVNLPPPTIGPSHVLADTAAAYRTEVQRLEGELIKTPKDESKSAALLATLLDFSNRFPAAYAADPTLDERTKQLAETVGNTRTPRLRALFLLREGKAEEARLALDQALAMAAEDPELLCLHGDAALQKEDTALARQYYARALALNPKMARAAYFLGWIDERVGKYEDARAQYASVLKIEPQHEAARLGLARLQLGDGDLESARKSAEEMLQSDQGSTEAQFEAHRILATIAEKQSDAAKQLEHLEAAVELSVANVEAVLDLASFYGANNRRTDARRVLVGAIDAGATAPSLYRAVVEQFVDTDTSAASRYAELAIDNNPGDPRALFLRAEVARARGHQKTAAAVFEQVVEKNPNHTEAYLRLAGILVEQGESERAQTVLERGLTRASGTSILQLELARVRQKNDQASRALDDYRAVLQADPANADARFEYAQLLSKMGFFDQSAAQFDMLRKQGRNTPEVVLAQAEALARAGKSRLALEELDRLVRTEPHNARAHTHLGLLHTELGSLKSAELSLETALRLQPSYAPALFAMGELERRRDRPRRAMSLFNQAVDASPLRQMYRIELARQLGATSDGTDRKRAIDQLDVLMDQREAGKRSDDDRVPDAAVYHERGRLHFEMGAFKPALEDFKRAVNSDPSLTAARADQGEALYRLKLTGQARNLMEDVLAQDGSNAKAHYYLGKIALNRGKRSEAEQHLQAAVRHGGDDYADAHKTLGYLFRERGQPALARREFRAYLKSAGPDATHREEVERVLARLR